MKKVILNTKEQKAWEQLKGKIKDSNDSETTELKSLKDKFTNALGGKKLNISFPKNSNITTYSK